MRSKNHKIAVLVLVSFFILVLGIALLLNPYYPVLVFAGESSAGTWMSGAMLVMAATLSLTRAIQKGWWPWIPVSIFFLMLVIDEHFMFHETIRERLLFAYTDLPWLSQLPILAAGLTGLFVTLILWREFLPFNRIILAAVVIFGGLSLIYDILEAGVMIEEILKLAAELCLVISLTGEMEPTKV